MDFLDGTIRVNPATQEQMQECLDLYHPSGLLASYGICDKRPFGLGEAMLTSYAPGYEPDFGDLVPIAHMDFPVLRGDGVSDYFGTYTVWLGIDGKATRVSYEGSTPGIGHKNRPRLFDMRMSADVDELFNGKVVSKNERGFWNYMFPGFGNDSVSFIERIMSRTG